MLEHTPRTRLILALKPIGPSFNRAKEAVLDGATNPPTILPVKEIRRAPSPRLNLKWRVERYLYSRALHLYTPRKCGL